MTTNSSFAMSFPCGSCGATIHSGVYVPVDVVCSPGLKDKLIAGDIIPFRCGNCGQSTDIKKLVFCAYWDKDWLGVALPMGGSTPAIWAIDNAKRLILSTTPARPNLPRVVSVYGNIDDLLFVITHPNNGAFRQDLVELLLPHWDEERIVLIKTANAFIEIKDFVWAYVVLAGVVQDIPEFYFFSSIREAMELCATAAGKLTMGAFSSNRTPMDDFLDMKEALDKHIPRVPELSGYKLFYDIPLDDNNQPLNNGGSIDNASPELRPESVLPFSRDHPAGLIG